MLSQTLETRGDTPMPVVTVYTKPGCVQCVATFKALDKAGVAYVVIDITRDGAARCRVRDLGYASAPVVVVSEAVHWSGFRPDRIKELVIVAA